MMGESKVVDAYKTFTSKLAEHSNSIAEANRMRGSAGRVRAACLGRPCTALAREHDVRRQCNARLRAPIIS
eukprot:4373025-Pleurochrysis_carterae.AAC.4